MDGNSVGNTMEVREDRTQLLVDGVVLSRRLCPQCGSKMRQTDRVNENGWVFIWYECEDAGCDGRWLQKYPRVSV